VFKGSEFPTSDANSSDLSGIAKRWIDRAAFEETRGGLLYGIIVGGSAGGLGTFAKGQLLLALIYC
jgi:hypothetical protein